MLLQKDLWPYKFLWLYKKLLFHKEFKSHEKLKRDRFLEKFDKKLQKYLQVNEIYLMTHLSILIENFICNEKERVCNNFSRKQKLSLTFKNLPYIIDETIK